MEPIKTHSRPTARWTLITAASAAVLYAPLWTGQWIPASDSTFYLSLARNIFQGRGYTFNNLPVVPAAPLWPFMLAGLMRISPSFAFLNAVPLACMTGALTLWHRILCRFVSPQKAFGLVLLSALLYNCFYLSNKPYSDAFFSLIMAGCLLLGVQFAQGERSPLRMGAIILLAAALPAIRWAGIIFGPLVVAALLAGRITPRLDRQWLAALLTAATMLVSFFALRTVVKNNALAGLARTETRLKIDKLTSIETTYSRPKNIKKRVVPDSEQEMCKFKRRLARSGDWLGHFFWPPAQMTNHLPVSAFVACALGWLVTAMFAVDALCRVRKLNWMWAGALVYLVILFFIWMRANTRYLAPIAPLWILGVTRGAASVGAVIPRRWWTMTWRGLAGAFVASIVLCNLPLWGISAWVIRRGDFYGAYHAGQCDSLVRAAKVLRSAAVGDDEVAVGYNYVNLGTRKANSFALRALNLLTNRTVRVVPKNISDQPHRTKLRLWLRDNSVKYYVYRPPVVPWRLWHFRSRRLHEMLTGRKVPPPGPYFELYELKNDNLVRIELDTSAPVQVRSVPGVENTAGH